MPQYTAEYELGAAHDRVTCRWQLSVSPGSAAQPHKTCMTDALMVPRETTLYDGIL